MRIIGIEHVKFTNKDNEVVEFDKVYAVETIRAAQGDGERAYTFNVGTDKTAGLTIGEDVEPLYNRFGRVRRFDYIVN